MAREVYEDVGVREISGEEAAARAQDATERDIAAQVRREAAKRAAAREAARSAVRRHHDIWHAYLSRTGPEGAKISADLKQDLNTKLASAPVEEHDKILNQHTADLKDAHQEQVAKIRADFPGGNPVAYIKTIKDRLASGSINPELAKEKISKAQDAISRTSVFVRQTSLKRTRVRGVPTQTDPFPRSRVETEATHEVIHPDEAGSAADLATARTYRRRASTFGPVEDRPAEGQSSRDFRLPGEMAVVDPRKAPPEGVIARPFRAADLTSPRTRVTGYTNQATLSPRAAAAPALETYGQQTQRQGTGQLGGRLSPESQRPGVAPKDRWKNLSRKPFSITHLLKFSGSPDQASPALEEHLPAITDQSGEAQAVTANADFHLDSIAHHLLHGKLTKSQIYGLKQSMDNISRVHGYSLQIPKFDRQGNLSSATQLDFCGYETCKKLRGHAPVKGEPSHMGSAPESWATQEQENKDQDEQRAATPGAAQPSDDYYPVHPYTNGGFSAVSAHHQRLHDLNSEIQSRYNSTLRVLGGIERDAAKSGKSPVDHPEWDSLNNHAAYLLSKSDEVNSRIASVKKWLDDYHTSQRSRGFTESTEPKFMTEPKTARVLAASKSAIAQDAADASTESPEGSVAEAEKTIASGKAPKGTRIVYSSKPSEKTYPGTVPLPSQSSFVEQGRSAVASGAKTPEEALKDIQMYRTVAANVKEGEAAPIRVPSPQETGEARVAWKPSTLPANTAQQAEEEQARSTVGAGFRVARGRVAIRRDDLISPMVRRPTPGAPATGGGWLRNLLDDSHLTSEQRAENAARPLTPARRGVSTGSFFEPPPEPKPWVPQETPEVTAHRQAVRDASSAVEEHTNALHQLSGGSQVDNLQEQLNRANEEHKSHVQTMEAARQEGDLRENSGYHAARETVAVSKARIDELSDRLEDAKSGKLAAGFVTVPSLSTAIAIRSRGKWIHPGDAMKIGSPEHQIAVEHHTAELAKAQGTLQRLGGSPSSGADVTPRVSSSLPDIYMPYVPSTRAATPRPQETGERGFATGLPPEEQASRESVIERATENTAIRGRSQAFNEGRG